jgi:hypothetical protein
MNWSSSYVNIPLGTNSFACATFDVPNTELDLFGCYAVSSSAGQPMGGSGVIQIPSWFLTATGLTGKRRVAMPAQ